MLSRHESDSLKGVAILAILINHFINHFYGAAHMGYANGVVSIFFLLSGYGIWYSLNRQPKRNWFKFVYQRIIRIYPLLVIAILLPSVIFGKTFYFNQFFTELLFTNLTKQTGYWFVEAIIYCYLLTPVFIFILDKLDFKRFIILFIGLTILLAIITLIKSNNIEVNHVVLYRKIIGGYFLFYHGGMGLNKYDEDIKKIRYLNYNLIFVLFFSLFTIITRLDINQTIGIISGIIYLFSGVALIGTFIKNNSLANTKINWLALLGKYSYSIYLFQPIYYSFIWKLSHNNFQYSLIMTIGLFPIFFITCKYAEKYDSIIYTKQT
jgi:peptidoglycan/LPS O-acetylase OafA/YrhL